MKHKIGYNRLGRKTAHRKAMTRNMLTSLFRHERIRTTKAKALAVRRSAEKMITRAKLDSVHNRRMIGREIKDKAILAKIFTEIGPRFKERPGGYTRVLKLGPRPSDAAEMVILELLSEEENAPAQSKKKSSSAKKKAAPKKKKTESPVDSEPEKADAADTPVSEETTAGDETSKESETKD
jgi:large subunit ribosomal protein L17